MYFKNLLKSVHGSIDKWLAKLRTIPTVKSSYGMAFRGVFDVLKNALYKTARRQPGIIAKVVATHIFICIITTIICFGCYTSVLYLLFLLTTLS